ncbi:MAG TPA: hypothetical protein VMV92_31115 [Streptosporangiaceae bacterium]|nr:hypothetical protein [Streptosporangiaceae bacterium]
MTDDIGLAEVRKRFLTADSIEPGQVRDTILASWWRSRRWNVVADHLDLSYVRDPDLDAPLPRNALPVLVNLRENLKGQPVSVILTDARGVVLSRLTADHDLERHLDGVRLMPGFPILFALVAADGGLLASFQSNVKASVFITSLSFAHLPRRAPHRTAAE